MQGVIGARNMLQMQFEGDMIATFKKHSDRGEMLMDGGIQGMCKQMGLIWFHVGAHMMRLWAYSCPVLCSTHLLIDPTQQT